MAAYLHQIEEVFKLIVQSGILTLEFAVSVRL